jgi:DNA polymerase-3 subunit gamma/tau
VDSVRYAPTSARYKVYIVDEVHMLSEKAFNGLLKTLEEPPPQTLFIFATTEVRKVPITVLSRCQRFDLRRIESKVLAGYFAAIAKREGIEIEDSALALIGHAAEGSVRDGLSLLDQAIALGGGTAITADQVQDMLGLADRKRVLDLFEQVMRGRIAEALGSFGDLHERGSEPDAVVQDLLEISHWLTRLKVASDNVEEPGGAGWDAERGRAMAGELSIATLSRAWQMLLKGLDDIRIAPSPLLAAEMLLIRLAHAADLPSAEAMLSRLGALGPATDGGTSGGPAANSGDPDPASGHAGVAATPSSASLSKAPVSAPGSGPVSGPVSGKAPTDADRSPAKHTSGKAKRTNGLAEDSSGLNADAVAPSPLIDNGAAQTTRIDGKADSDPDGEMPIADPTTDEAPGTIGSFSEAVDLFRANNKLLLYSWLHSRAKLVHFEPGRIELETGDQLLTERRSEIAGLLRSWTGEPWQLVESEKPGSLSLTDQEAQAKQQRLTELADDPRIKPVLETFPGAKIIDVQKPSTTPLNPRKQTANPQKQTANSQEQTAERR